MELQGGLVVAILIGAVLLVDRLGGNDELSRRLLQVTLAMALVFAVVSGTNAIIRPAEDGSFTSGDSNEAADRVAAAMIVHYAFGVLFFVGGFTALRRMHTVPIAFLLAGALLVFMGASLSGLEPYSELLRFTFESSAEVDAVAFIAALGGVVALLWLGFRQESEYALSEGGAEDDDQEEELPLVPPA